MVVNINAQINNYKERVVGNYTLRQMVCLILALILGATTYFYLDIQKDIKQFIVIISVLPIVALGFYTYQGVTCEVYLYYVIREFLLPQKRPFKPEDNELHIDCSEEGVVGEYDKKFSKKNKKRKVNKVQNT